MSVKWSTILLTFGVLFGPAASFRIKASDIEQQEKQNSTGYEEKCCCWNGFSNSGERSSAYRMRSFSAMCAWRDPKTKMGHFTFGLRREPKNARQHLTVQQPLTEDQAYKMKTAFAKTQHELLCIADPLMPLMSSKCYRSKKSYEVEDMYDVTEKMAQKYLAKDPVEDVDYVDLCYRLACPDLIDQSEDMQCPTTFEKFSTEVLARMKREEVYYWEDPKSFDYSPSICMSNSGAGSGWGSRFSTSTPDNLHLEHFGLVGWMCPPSGNEHHLNFQECSRAPNRWRSSQSICADTANVHKLAKSKCTPPDVE